MVILIKHNGKHYQLTRRNDKSAALDAEVKAFTAIEETHYISETPIEHKTDEQKFEVSKMNRFPKPLK